MSSSKKSFRILDRSICVKKLNKISPPFLKNTIQKQCTSCTRNKTPRPFHSTHGSSSNISVGGGGGAHPKQQTRKLLFKYLKLIGRLLSPWLRGDVYSHPLLLAHQHKALRAMLFCCPVSQFVVLQSFRHPSCFAFFSCCCFPWISQRKLPATICVSLEAVLRVVFFLLFSTNIRFNAGGPSAYKLRRKKIAAKKCNKKKKRGTTSAIQSRFQLGEVHCNVAFLAPTWQGGCQAWLIDVHFRNNFTLLSAGKCIQ